jgi:hypothetical protein
MLYPLSAKLRDVHIYLVHLGKSARGDVQPGIDASAGGTLLLFWACRAAVLARGLVLSASDRNNRAEIGDGPSPHRTRAAAGLAADANRAEHRDPHLPGRAAGAGVAPGTWIPAVPSRTGMEVVGSGDAGSDASMPAPARPSWLVAFLGTTALMGAYAVAKTTAWRGCCS